LNGITLDYSLDLKDLGLSAFSSAHKKRGALGKFLAAVDNGRIKKGEILLLEAIDRLTREHPIDAYDMISQLVRAGIEIHTIEDGAIYNWASLDNGEARRLADKIDQARQYSKRLSRRVSAAWEEKKTKSEFPITRRCPAWLRVEGDQYIAIPDRVKIVRRIFTETANGIGREAIARRLNLEKVPTFDRAGQGVANNKPPTATWHASYIQKILRNRAVLGFYQPHEKRTANGKKRVPVGEEREIYPPAIKPELWQRSAAARAERKLKGGRRGPLHRNILSGLCICAKCDGKMTYRAKGKRSANYLVCDSAIRGTGCVNRVHFRYDLIENTILDTIIRWRLLRPSLFASTNDEEKRLAEELASITIHREKVSARIANLFASFDGGPSKSAATKISELDVELEATTVKIKELDASLDVARGSSQLLHVDRIVEVRKRANEGEDGAYEARALLRQALHSVVKFVVFFPEDRNAFVALKAMIMTFVITKDGDAKEFKLHANGNTVFLDDVGNGVALGDTPGMVSEWQQLNADDVVDMFKLMSF
jgi:DNA invertase Pin-like site-specific DNA recombinase